MAQYKNQVTDRKNISNEELTLPFKFRVFFQIKTLLNELLP